MDQLLGTETPFARFVADALKRDNFILIDVGAGGGIASAWRCFGDRLGGFGFDPDAVEVERLNQVETAPGFHYVSGYVGVPAEHPFAQRRQRKPRIARSPWARLATNRWFEIRRARQEGTPVPPNVPRPLPRGEDGGESSDDLTAVIVLPEFLENAGITTIDFLKIDVDGTDFDILQSMAGLYEKFGILGIGIEVNYFGSDSDTGNTFHNIDRFLKNQKFELLDMSVRRYPVQDLPVAGGLGLVFPGVCDFGRPFQGDAFFARDVCAPWEGAFTEGLSAERLAKSAALFAMFRSPDSAAEVLVTFRDRLAPLLDVDRGLDLLARQVQPGVAKPLSYRDYIASFENGGFVRSPSRSRPGLSVQPLVAATAYDGARCIVYPDASCSGTGNLRIRTPTQQWAHAVEVPLDAAGLDPDRPLRLVMRVLVHRGCAGLGALTAGGSLPQEVLISDADGARLVELVTNRLSEAGNLLVRNTAIDGASELEVEILAITALEGPVSFTVLEH